MTPAIVWLALLLLCSVVLGAMVRTLRGPTMIDRLLAAQLVSTGGVAVVLLLGDALDVSSLLDLALIVALLAAVAATAFLRWAGHGQDDAHRGGM